LATIAELRAILHDLHPNKGQPIDHVHWVPIEQVRANDYNPNSVASKEMDLLYTSILHDGYTQPIVTVHDAQNDVYVIIDGFHRYFTAKANKDILERNGGLLPIVVLDKSINDRMASTVRHNRARGEHSVSGMAGMVFQMLENGWEDADICNELGMEPEEILRLKHITGFSKLFEDAEYSESWKTKNMLRLERDQGVLGEVS
jgi:ParB-like chromosome segregation protein Spo0J